MSVFPIQAKIHPLKFKYSVAAGLAASAHLAIDVQDTLAELAGQFMKAERDNRLVRLIADNAPRAVDPELRCDAQSVFRSPVEICRYRSEIQRS
jgi:hypothetical protein